MACSSKIRKGDGRCDIRRLGTVQHEGFSNLKSLCGDENWGKEELGRENRAFDYMFISLRVPNLGFYSRDCDYGKIVSKRTNVVQAKSKVPE